MRRVNLGGNERFDGGPGSSPLDDWEHVDLRALPGVTHLCDVSALPADWHEQFDEVRASHIVEHFPLNRGPEIIKQWARILKPGGLLRIYCPDALHLASALVLKLIDITQFSRLMFGDQDYDLNLHRAAYNREILDRFVLGAGLIIESRDPRPHFEYPYEIGVQARQPERR